MENKKYLCPCCQSYEFDDGPGSYDICPVCFWENDKIQAENPDYTGGANRLSLNECRKNYKKYGACEEKYVSYIRKNKINEIKNEIKNEVKINGGNTDDIVSEK